MSRQAAAMSSTNGKEALLYSYPPASSIDSPSSPPSGLYASSFPRSEAPPSGSPTPTFSQRKLLYFLTLVILGLVGGLTTLLISLSSSDDSSSITPTYATEKLSPSTFLVESIPTNSTTALPTSLLTWEAEVALLNAAKHSIDITVMYWNLLPSDNTFCNSDATTLDYCINALQGSMGVAVYAAMEAAAKRGVAMRFVNDIAASATDKQDLPGMDKNNPQLKHLLTYSSVKARFWNASTFYAGGIMHQKVWVVDGIHAYIGSSNMDWLSLSQVKEMGIAVYNSTSVGSNVQNYFNTWWDFADPEVASWDDLSVKYNSTQFQTELEAPCWSYHFADDAACESPLTPESPYPNNIKTPLTVALNPSSAESTSFISGCPRETLGSLPRSARRTWDLDSLLHTIRSATSHVYLSVMDYQPSSLYSSDTVSGNTVWWKDLNDALLEVQYAKNVSVHMLISNWEHSKPIQFELLKMLKGQGTACGSKCGKFEVKVYEVPGWNQTDTDEKHGVYPPYSRVAHGKFIVSDKRANIGTSNMAWSYFYSTAGSSFNTDDEGVVEDLSAAFLRDWYSDYAFDLDAWMERGN